MVKRCVAPCVFWFCAGLTALAAEGDGKPVVDGQRTKSYVVHLSSDALQGRMSCTEGYRQAAEWSAARFQEWGLKPAGEKGTFYQQVKVPPFTLNTGVPSLAVNGQAFSRDDGDFSLLGSSTPATTLQGEVVFVGYGISAPQKGLDEYQGLDVTGKVVLAMAGSPKDAPAPRQAFAPGEKAAADQKAAEQEEWKDESTELTKTRVAFEKGAAAILIFNPDEAPEPGRRRGYSGRPSEEKGFEPTRNFLAFSVRERVWRAILRRDPQESPQGLARRIDRLRREIKQKRPQSAATGAVVTLKGYDATVRYDEQHGNNTDSNVLAKIEGTDPQLKDEYVLVGAHLDHIGMRNGYVYNGADDNASGSAVVLEVARVLAESKFAPKRTLLFALWCAEERGLIGSLHYTHHPCDGVTMDKVVTCFNLDMVGMGDTLPASGALNFPTLWEVIKRNQDEAIMSRIKPEEGGPGGSDHTGFIERGIEAMMLLSTGGVGHPDYHQPEDDVEKIEPEMLRIAGQFVAQGMMNLAQETQVPLLVERRQDLYRGMRTEIVNLNPELQNSQWSVFTVAQKTKEELLREVHDRARELFRGAAAPGESSSEPKTEGRTSPAKKTLAKGLADARLVGDDTQLLQTVVDLYGIGRMDLKGEDGIWVVGGRLTDKGKDAVRALEESGVVVRLISPPESLVRDLLSAATKPIIVTGNFEIGEELVDELNGRQVRIGVNLDPKNVEDFLARLEKARKQLGERSNLFAYLTSVDGLSEARRPLYLRLVDCGWSHREIAGGREHRGLLRGGNLDTLLAK